MSPKADKQEDSKEAIADRQRLAINVDAVIRPSLDYDDDAVSNLSKLDASSVHQFRLSLDHYIKEILEIKSFLPMLLRVLYSYALKSDTWILKMLEDKKLEENAFDWDSLADFGNDAFAPLQVVFNELYASVANEGLEYQFDELFSSEGEVLPTDKPTKVVKR